MTGVSGDGVPGEGVCGDGVMVSVLQYRQHLRDGMEPPKIKVNYMYLISDVMITSSYI